MPKTRILIVEDVTLWRDALRAYLSKQDDIEVIGEATSSDEATRMTQALGPELVLVDMALERVSGPGLAQALLKAHEGLKLLLLTTCEDEHCVQGVLEIGVHGVVLKRSEGCELLRAIRAAAKGQTYVDSRLRPHRESGQDTATQGLLDSLTGEELELCRLLALGHTNAEAREKLGLSNRKIEHLRARLMLKLSCGGRSELVRFALDTGLI